MALAIVQKTDVDESYLQHYIHGLTAEQITSRLGFSANVADDSDRVINSWAFTLNGQDCAVWDYKGSHTKLIHSAFGPFDLLSRVFSGHIKPAYG